MTPIVDIVIPVYNEGENIVIALKRIEAEVKFPYRVLVVYDIDTDTTLGAIETARGQGLFSHMNLHPTKNKYGRGALNAIKTGLETASSEFVVVTMADLSDPPSVINNMINKAQIENADLVCGSRYMKGGSQVGGPLLKRTLSRLAGISLRYIINFPTHDVTNSFKLYRKTILNSINIESTGGFELGMEIVVKAWALGLKVNEVPTSWEDRAAGESRFRLFKWLPCYLKWYFVAFGQKISFLFHRKKSSAPRLGL
jgi:glycosyltransferase involved in cell wall biosynthesis